MLEIITVTKDDLEGFARTLDSTLEIRAGQSARQLVIDSSGDGVRQQVEQMCLGEPNVDYVWSEPRGIAPAFNHGLSLAAGEWIWFLNGGDIVHPELEIDKLLYILRETNAAAIVFQYETMQERKRSRQPPVIHKWPPILNWIPHPSTIVRREVYEEHGGFCEDYRIAMDHDFWIRAFSQNIVVDTICIPIALFDTSGVSRLQRGATAKESMAAIRRNLPLIIRVWIKSGKRIFDGFMLYRREAKTK